MPGLPPRIALLLQRSPAEVDTRRAAPVSAVTESVCAALRQSGAHVDLLFADDTSVALGNLRPAHDLYVLKSKTPLTLALADAFGRGGAAVVNSVESSTLTRDKVASVAVLAAAGVPLPASWATGQESHVRALLLQHTLWLKPQRGSHGAGVRRLVSAAELDAAQAPTTDVFGLPVPLFCQADVPSGGFDVKVYVIGDRAWAIARRFPATTMADKIGTPMCLTPALHETALRCGAALGLDVYGVDFLMDHDHHWVVDVNALPGFKGVDGAPAAMAEFLFARATSGAGAPRRTSTVLGRVAVSA